MNWAIFTLIAIITGLTIWASYRDYQFAVRQINRTAELQSQIDNLQERVDCHQRQLDIVASYVFKCEISNGLIIEPEGAGSVRQG